MELNGDWNSRKKYCSCGYKGIWRITVNGDEMTVQEQPGAHCCFFVPNCFRKTHHMMKKDENKWVGNLGCKRISITRISDNELEHWTTDGAFILTRAD